MAWWEEAWLRQQPKEKQIDCLRRLLDLSEQEMLRPGLGGAGLVGGCCAGVGSRESGGIPVLFQAGLADTAGNAVTERQGGQGYFLNNQVKAAGSSLRWGEGGVIKFGHKFKRFDPTTRRLRSLLSVQAQKSKGAVGFAGLEFRKQV